MAKLVQRPEADLYRTDYYRWLEEQATLLREGRLLDLIEEFEELAVGERLPEQLPYTLDQILDPTWLPENRHGIGNDPPVRA